MKLHTGMRSIFSIVVIVSLALGLQACGGGGGSSSTPTPADANPVGYYAGTLTVTSPAQANLNAKAIVDSDKFLMVHIDQATPDVLLYKGTFTDITPTTFTADVRIYRNGAFLRTATITNGSITEKVSMSGTLSGTGDYTATSFSLTYDTTINARTPLVSANRDVWIGATLTSTGIAFNTATVISNVYENNALIHDVLKGCDVTGQSLTNVSSEQPGRIRTFTVTYVNGDGCVNYAGDITLTGYITPFDSGADDNRYLWITYNDNNFYADELVKQ
jgi:hypothetical protein